jgi:hypothetical protein
VVEQTCGVWLTEYTTSPNSRAVLVGLSVDPPIMLVNTTGIAAPGRPPSRLARSRSTRTPV